jgi:hypothetical protein
MNGPTSLPGLHLLDLTALVAGYAMASLLVRAFWPSGSSSEAGVVVVLGLVYLWLGLAMSGPLILAVRRRGSRDEPAADPQSLSWAEMAWSIIGFYWIGLTVLVVPVRLAHTRLLDTALLGVFPILAALGLRLFGPKRGMTPGTRTGLDPPRGDRPAPLLAARLAGHDPPREIPLMGLRTDHSASMLHSRRVVVRRIIHSGQSP